MKEIADIHYVINSRSAYKLYNASLKLDNEFRMERMQDMSGDCGPQIDKYHEESLRRLYRRYGIKHWNEYVELMTVMHQLPPDDLDESSVIYCIP